MYMEGSAQILMHLIVMHYKKEREYSIDPTATRSLIGNSYPMPGLSSKFFDRNQDPIIEVMQDSIGRHDTFGTVLFSKNI